MAHLDHMGVVVACSQCGQRNRVPFQNLSCTVRCGRCKTEIPPVGSPVEVRSAEDFHLLLRSADLPLLTDFWAPWCGPCKMVAPELEKVAARRAGDWLVIKVNTEALASLAEEYQISSIPTLLVFAEGREIGRSAGARPGPAIEAFVEQVLAASPAHQNV